ncbi:hypothetical protein HMPREF3208_00045 [Gardnerella vaginalis]|uniref:Uncharacterized protein n=1 Tax=Gardnerella vaginalis TaxID=2702 RepID=A0A133P302_GARVA|nr:hypothetical protein HMPREF3208_00045 [Gardnerella vaginalis]
MLCCTHWLICVKRFERKLGIYYDDFYIAALSLPELKYFFLLGRLCVIFLVWMYFLNFTVYICWHCPR